MGKLLIPYLTAGYPQKSWLKPLVESLDQAGADYIELGIPFSDPIADGPTIQAASQQALDNGAGIRWALETVAELPQRIREKLILFSYYNPILALGDADQAAARLAELKLFGVLVPDLSLEQAEPFIAALQKHKLHYIPLIAPTTDDQRLARIAPFTSAFAYGVSVTGVTGARSGVSTGLDQYLQRVRKHLNKTFVVGFGIATPEDAANIAKISDGVVVGSALVKAIGAAKTLEEAQTQVAEMVGGMRRAIDQT